MTSSWRCSGATTGRSCRSRWRPAGTRTVELWTPRFHGDGRADWDVLVSITYRDWAAIQEHSDAEIARRLYPDQEAFKAEESRRFALLDAHWDVVLESRPLDG